MITTKTITFCEDIHEYHYQTQCHWINTKKLRLEVASRGFLTYARLDTSLSGYGGTKRESSVQGLKHYEADTASVQPRGRHSTCMGRPHRGTEGSMVLLTLGITAMTWGWDTTNFMTRWVSLGYFFMALLRPCSVVGFGQLFSHSCGS